MKQPKVSAIICAAGKGERAGFGRNKLLAPLYGAPALYYTLKKFNIPEIDEVIVTSSKDDFKEIGELCSPLGYKVVLGGETRTDSVKHALESVTGDIVLIHDGARPFVSHELIDECIESVKHYGSGICSIRATDTAVYGNYGVITEGLDRSCLYLLQTPQGFLTDEIVNAYALAGDKQYTDDSAVYSEFIATPRLISGSLENIKLTYKQDFQRKYTPFRPLPECAERAGFGVDVHTFGEGNEVTLCGVKIPCDRGLIAHSDGDVAIHAIMDAFLSAAGLKDIGHYFPDTDNALEGADSGKLLEKVMELIFDRGYKPLNLSVSIQAEKPRLAAHIDKMKENLSKITGLDVGNIGVAAGTCEGLGFVGEGLGITAYCTAMLRKK
jgi:2-C-methyl-D-erythritol 4-phosphate cytidylyltransferase/2-C-methyl-D-erythritol 2,4-cyclodiphosphate synthase